MQTSDFLDAPPIFVGGTGRSGTTIVGALLGAHRIYAAVPIELRFHTDDHGLRDVLASRMSMDQFVARMHGDFFFRETPGGPRGLHLIIDREALSREVDVFRREYEVDRFGAGRNLVLSLTKSVREQEGKPSWVEATPYNVEAAGMLLRLFPEAKVVHSVRDGRDVAASVAQMWWGPDNLVDGLHWWCESLRAADAATKSLPVGTVHVLQFEELVCLDRDRCVTDLCDYLRIDDSGIRDFLDTRMTVDLANISRWKKLNVDDATSLDYVYRSMYQELRNDGVTCLPLPPDWSDN